MADQKPYALFCAAAGTDLSVCLNRIKDYFHIEVSRLVRASEPPPASLSVTQAKQYLHDPRQSADRPVLLTYRQLMARPRPEIFALWNQSIRRAIEALDPSTAYRIMGCHLTVFDPRTKVFHAPAFASTFAGVEDDSVSSFAPSHVVLLIDDVYDMYRRLSGDRDIYPTKLRQELTIYNLIQFTQRGAAADFERDVEDEEFFAADLDARIGGLKSLLAWRRSEMIIAENLAEQLGVPLILLGTKHPLSQMSLLLRDPKDIRVTYISHPITRYRQERAQADAPQWNPDVGRLNALPAALARHKVLAIMPTAIDELRFCPPTRDDLLRRTGALSHRWPLIEEPVGLIGYDASEPADANLGLSDIPIRGDWLSKDRAPSVYLRTLESLIYDEIPFRDHYLVNHCPCLLVFRPRAEGHVFSGGVQQEIGFFQELARTETARRMAVVHEEVDVTTILSGLTAPDDEIRQALLAHAEAYVTEHFLAEVYMPPSPNLVRRVVRAGQLTGSQLSELSIDPSDLHDLRYRSWRFAVERLMYEQLTGLSTIFPGCQIFVGALSPGLFVDIAKWLHDTTVSDAHSNVRAIVGDKALAESTRSLALQAGVGLER